MNHRSFRAAAPWFRDSPATSANQEAGRGLLRGRAPGGAPLRGRRAGLGWEDDGSTDLLSLYMYIYILYILYIYYIYMYSYDSLYNYDIYIYIDI
jgi:hypothetical protein